MAHFLHCQEAEKEAADLKAQLQQATAGSKQADFAAQKAQQVLHQTQASTSISHWLGLKQGSITRSHSPCFGVCLAKDAELSFWLLATERYKNLRDVAKEL
jgi:hypothetical protein